MEWVMLLIGAVVETVFSLVVDRLVRRYIEVPTVKMDSIASYSHDFGQSFDLKVTNVGSVPLPPFDVVLYHPAYGSPYWFRKTEESERLPGQREVFPSP